MTSWSSSSTESLSALMPFSSKLRLGTRMLNMRTTFSRSSFSLLPWEQLMQGGQSFFPPHPAPLVMSCHPPRVDRSMGAQSTPPSEALLLLLPAAVLVGSWAMLCWGLACGDRRLGWLEALKPGAEEEMGVCMEDGVPIPDMDKFRSSLLPPAPLLWFPLGERELRPLGLGWGSRPELGVPGMSGKGSPGGKCPLKGNPGLGNRPWWPAEMGPLGDMSGECWGMDDGGCCACINGGGGPWPSVRLFLAISMARATSSMLLCCMLGRTGGGGILKMVWSPGLMCVDM